VFLVGELERLDQTLHMPLVEVSWQRDIDLREDVSIADEVSSFTNSSFAATGGLTPGGIAWIAKDANAITGIGLDITAAYVVTDSALAAVTGRKAPESTAAFVSSASTRLPRRLLS
jgi:hypothetical protein